MWYLERHTAVHNRCIRLVGHGELPHSMLWLTRQPFGLHSMCVLHDLSPRHHRNILHLQIRCRGNHRSKLFPFQFSDSHFQFRSKQNQEVRADTVHHSTGDWPVPHAVVHHSRPDLHWSSPQGSCCHNRRGPLRYRTKLRHSKPNGRMGERLHVKLKACVPYIHSNDAYSGTSE